MVEMAEHQASPGERPSFATFWRSNQNDPTAKELKFVQSIPGQSSKKCMREHDQPTRAAVPLLIASTPSPAVTSVDQIEVLAWRYA